MLVVLYVNLRKRDAGGEFSRKSIKNPRKIQPTFQEHIQDEQPNYISKITLLFTSSVTKLPNTISTHDIIDIQG